MFVQLLNQNATNILEKTRRFMAFQVSVTHWSLLTPFCHQAAVVSRGGEGNTAGEEGAGAEKMEEKPGASGSGGQRGEWEPQG